MRTIHAVSLALLLGTWSLSALGQDESAVATARQLGEEGLSAYDAGRYDEAAEKLVRAYQVVKVPTFARNAARALAKQGKLVAASELYLEATRLTPNERWRGDLQQIAQRDAAEERAALLPRIAHLKIVLTGATAHETQVTVDDVAIPEALVGMEQFADPGARRVIAKRGAQTVEQRVDLREGEHRELALRFEAATTAPTAQPQPVVAPVAAPVAQPLAPVPSPQPESRGDNTQRTLGWVGIGLGAAGVLTGTATGIVALIKRSDLHSDSCTGDVCHRADQQDPVDTYNALRTVSTIGFIVGGVGAAAGATLLLTSPKRESPTGVSLRLGPGSVALTGGF